MGIPQDWKCVPNLGGHDEINLGNDDYIVESEPYPHNMDPSFGKVGQVEPNLLIYVWKAPNQTWIKVPISSLIH